MIGALDAAGADPVAPGKPQPAHREPGPPEDPVFHKIHYRILPYLKDIIHTLLASAAPYRGTVFIS
jgi:hypothetical protein